MSRRIPVHLKVLRGNPGHQALKPWREPQPERSPEPPEPPSFLSGYAADEWRRVSPELFRLRLLTQLDIQVLAVYCDSYERWRTARETVAAMAERDPITRGQIVKTQSGGAAPNPLVWIAASAAKDMLRFAGELGCTPIARSRLAEGGGPTRPSKFAGLLAGVRDGDDRA